MKTNGGTVQNISIFRNLIYRDILLRATVTVTATPKRRMNNPVKLITWPSERELGAMLFCIRPVSAVQIVIKKMPMPAVT